MNCRRCTYLGAYEDVLTFLMDQLGTKLLIENAKEEIN